MNSPRVAKETSARRNVGEKNRRREEAISPYCRGAYWVARVLERKKSKGVSLFNSFPSAGPISIGLLSKLYSMS
ncbi:hypothetical protein HPP92_000399 [Vanilla planifolia]|uniref:Uncharacterized protein n=1 Tax=Vanilla planifolia TaxID=51239 RepID=A0A835SB46_VANPL|nr:hypothetical protein HPP92_000399 [Vanilla planifolia]